MDKSYSEFRQNLKQTIDWTADTHESVFITSHKERKAVLMSYDDYCSLTETAYLLRSPKNAKRLLESVLDMLNGDNAVSKGLLDE